MSMINVLKISLGLLPSRCCLVGGAMGAQVGVESLPAEWISKSLHSTEIVELSEKLVTLRKD